MCSPLLALSVRPLQHYWYAATFSSWARERPRAIGGYAWI
jgi:hypothetical protein